MCRHSGALVHTTRRRWVGKLPVDFRGLGVDALSAAAHNSTDRWAPEF